MSVDSPVDVPFHKHRLDICRSCPRYFNPTGTCKECGCFMTLKTRLKSAECPIGKW